MIYIINPKASYKIKVVVYNMLSVLYILLYDCFITLKKIDVIYIITCQVC